MSELDTLLDKARRVDPVPPRTIERVEARLAKPETGLGLVWLAPALALIVVWVLRAPEPSALRVDNETMNAPRFIAHRYADKAPPPPMKVRTKVSPIEAPPALVQPASLPTPAPEIIATVPEPGPAPSGRALVTRYRPRATRELDIDWRTLEQEELSKIVRSIVERRDRNRLLAALDGERPLSPTLLVARGRLRAAAERCDEAIGDFDRALEAGAEEPSRSLALDGRAACQP